MLRCKLSYRPALQILATAALATPALFTPAARADGPTAPREILLENDGATFARNGALITKLDAVEFYRLVGREDLVEKLELNESRIHTTRAIGAMLLGLGTVVATTGSLVEIGDALQWQKPAQSGMVFAGLGLGVAGVVLICLGQGDPQPIDLKARRALVDDYNARVISRTAAPKGSEPLIANLSLEPIVAGGAHGVGLSGSF